MSNDNAFYRLYIDPDFIAIRRFEYSLRKLLDRYPDGAPDRIIAQALMIEEAEVEAVYGVIVEKLRAAMVPERKGFTPPTGSADPNVAYFSEE